MSIFTNFSTGYRRMDSFRWLKDLLTIGLLLFSLLLAIPSTFAAIEGKKVKDEVFVYHFIVNHWGNSFSGVQDCPNMPHLKCKWTYADHLKKLRKEYKADMRAVRARRRAEAPPPTVVPKKDDDEWNWSIHTDPDHPYKEVKPSGDSEFGEDEVINGTYTISVYNIHSLWERKKEHHPAICELRTNVTMVESEESKVRYGHLFGPSFKNFDGYSTTSPMSHLQRVYSEVFLNETEMLPNKPFAKLVKGASYVASDCHKRDSANANRDNVALSIRESPFRVDGLGRCLRTPVGPEGLELPKTRDTRYNLILKREVISNYMFNLAFENSLEPGYVTEKPFDAMLSGTVPIYLGDAKHLKRMLPHPMAAIFLDDFGGDAQKLVEYLNMLAQNETAYEEHRAWRKDGVHTLKGFLRRKQHLPFIHNSWACRVCQWALDASHTHHKRRRNCARERNDDQGDSVDSFEKVDPSYYNGRAVRANGREVYWVQNGQLQLIPSLDTFFALNLSLTDVIQIGDREFRQIPKGAALPYMNAPEGK